MSLKTIDQLTLKGKRVFIRVDFNVARDKKTGAITDDTRIRASLPTIQYAISQGARVVLASHLGRPKGEASPDLSLVHVGERLSDLLNQDVLFTESCVGDGIRKLVGDLNDGGVALLENLRFHKEETANDPKFSKALASLADVYVNDAFGTCHRAHASTVGMVSHFEEKAAGFLVQKELEHLGSILENPKRPFVAILGGAKVSDKIPVIENLLTKVNTLLIGGAMAYTFLAAKGVEVGASLIEPEKFHLASKILKRAVERNVKIVLPLDHLIAKDAGSKGEVSLLERIAPGFMGFDIGPKTLELYSKIIAEAGTIFWNGPLGMFEVEAFSAGTLGIARAVAASGAISVAGGGDSLAAIQKTGLASQFTHLSTGGGATLEYLEGKKLPGLEALET